MRKAARVEAQEERALGRALGPADPLREVREVTLLSR